MAKKITQIVEPIDANLEDLTTTIVVQKEWQKEGRY